MKRVLVISASLFLLCSFVLAASSPDNRSITDPQMVTSESNSGAHPVPIDDLYYTRESSGPAWSPNGREVAFTTGLAGRAHVWKVNARSEEHTSELQSLRHLVCRLLLEKKKIK